MRLRSAGGDRYFFSHRFGRKQTFTSRDVSDIKDETIPVCAVHRNRQPHRFMMLVEGLTEDLDDLDPAISWQIKPSAPI